MYHRKGLIVDGWCWYTGNGNFTHCSRHANVERLLRLGGPDVSEALDGLARDRVSGRLWDGK